MSLNEAERQRTKDELARNLELSGLSEVAAAAALGYAPDRLRDALSVDGADPVDVWEVRDFVERAVRESGREPVAFTVLTEDARVRAEGWFPLR
ncbi:DUF2316 family protein [Actinoplanes bogorensis]|uniref:DUF2316 family protein n=1 Tax=Paractinoplanes bogorensis TaxID=1610840 RepID=A0ABS5YMB2_9ACTN|nr:DUF2316 family protein [Actinoplanes bogorensis]MBU2664471.1 DUF2316 family protein [Actinoplanes bogorensis]